MVLHVIIRADEKPRNDLPRHSLERRRVNKRAAHIVDANGYLYNVGSAAMIKHPTTKGIV